MRKVKGYRYLPKLQEAISRELGIDQDVLKKAA
jgi:hypothetical protein